MANPVLDFLLADTPVPEQTAPAVPELSTPAMSGNSVLNYLLTPEVEPMPIPLDKTAHVPKPPTLIPDNWNDNQEAEFKEWYKGWAEEAGINPNPDDPRHQYNYRAAYVDRATPQLADDGKLHWPSKFKMEDHPNRFVDGIDTITGKPMTMDQQLRHLQVSKGVSDAEMPWWKAIANSIPAGGLDAADTYARAGRVLGLDTTKAIETVKKARDGYKIPEDGLVGIIAQGISSTINSVAAGVPGGLLGTVGGPVGTVGGFALGAGGLFSLAEYDRFMEEAEAAGLKREDVMVEGIVSAVTEGGVEALQDLVLAKVHGLLNTKAITAPVKQSINQALRKFLTNTGRALPVEAGGEVLTGIVQTEARQRAGIPQEDFTTADAFKTAAVTAVQTFLMGGVAAGFKHRQINRAAEAYDALPEADKAMLAKAAAAVNALPKAATEEEKRTAVAKALRELEVLPKPAEAVPKEMGAFPGIGVEEAQELQPRERKLAETREALENAGIPIEVFASHNEAIEAGLQATQEDVDNWTELKDAKDYEATTLRESGKLKEAAVAIAEASRYSAAIEAFQNPARYENVKLTIEKKGAEGKVEVEELDGADASILMDMNGQIVEQEKDTGNKFSFDNAQDREWLKSLGYTDKEIDMAKRYAYRLKSTRPKPYRMSSLREPTEAPGGRAPTAQEIAKKQPEKVPYSSAPDSLMGISKDEGRQKGYYEQNYKYELPVKVTFSDGTVHYDEVKGLNEAHAMERARRNWEGARIEKATPQETEASIKLVAKKQTAQIAMFREKVRAKRKTVEKWVQPKDEVILDEETGEKVKSVVVTPEAEQALEKAGVKTGAGPFPTTANFLVSVTEEKGGLIYGRAKSTDKVTTKTKDLLTGKETIKEYTRTIAGKEFKVLNTPIMPKAKKSRSNLIDELVGDFKKYVGWYGDWNDFMSQLVPGKTYSKEDTDKFIKIQTVLSAGASPAGAQTAFGKLVSVLEAYGSIEGGEGKGTTKNIAAKVNKIWKGEDKDIVTLEGMQKAYGMKIGAMMFAGLHPGTQEGAVVVDRHIARLWGYNAMWGGSFRVPSWLQEQITADIVEASQRLKIPLAGVQAALWYASGAGHWGSATRFEEAIRLQPKKSLSYSMVHSITLEPQAITSFRGHIYYTIKGATKPQPLTKDETKRLGDLLEKAHTMGMAAFALTESESKELLALQSKKEGIAPSSWSRNDVVARMEAETPDNRYAPLGYWYGPGVRREAWFYGKEPHLTMLYEDEIYDAIADKLGYTKIAEDRARSDALVKKNERTWEQVYMNALANTIARAGKVPGGRDFKGFALDRYGETWVFTFDEMVVEEQAKEVTVALSDAVQGVMDLPADLQDLANMSSNLAANLYDHIVKKLKNYPVSVTNMTPTLAKFDDATSGQSEYGLSLKVKGPLTAIRAAFSDIIGTQRNQNMVILFHGEGATNGQIVRFTFEETDLKKIQKELVKYGISDFNLRFEAGKWSLETFVFGSEEDAKETVDRLLSLFENKGVEGSLRNTRASSELLTREETEDGTGYKTHILKYYGKTKGEEAYERGISEGGQWTATARVLSDTEAARAGVQRGTARKERSVLDDFREPEAEEATSRQWEKLNRPSTEKPETEAQLERIQLKGFEVGSGWSTIPLAGNRDEIEVNVNPSLSSMRGMLNKSKSGSVRAFIDTNGNLYVWDAYKAIHAEVSNAYGIELNEDYVFMFMQKPLGGGEQAEYKQSAQSFEDLLAAQRHVRGAVAMLGGEVAAGAPTGTLGQAQTMTTAGESVNKIWKQTGWIKGAEGKWKFEIDDTKAMVKDPATNDWATKALRGLLGNNREDPNWVTPVTLNQVLNHSALYNYYPELRDIKIEVERSGTGAAYEPAAKTIIISRQRLKNGADLVESIFHEVQHAVQDIEGFAMGSSPFLEYQRIKFDPAYKKYGVNKLIDLAEQIYLDNAGEIEAMDTSERLMLSTSERKKIAPYQTGLARLPMNKWVIRGKGTSFTVDTKQAYTRNMLTFYRNWKRGNVAARAIVEALQTSGLAKYPEVLKNIDLIVKPFVFIDPKDLSAKSLRGHAAKFNMTVAEVEEALRKGAAQVQGLTSWSGDLHAIVSLSTGVARNFAGIKGTAFHEFWHVIERLVLPKEVLDQFVLKVPDSEKRAEMARAYFTGKPVPGAPTLVTKILDMIKQFLWDLHRRLYGLQISHPNQVFEWMSQGMFKPTAVRLAQKGTAARASADLVNDLQDMETGEGRFHSVATPPEIFADDETTGKKRVKEMVDNWMRPDAAIKMDEDAWVPPKSRTEEQDLSVPNIMEMPEIVQIYELLTNGKLPGVRKLLFGQADIRGVFLGKSGNVRLKADIFKDPVLAARVLAHEIGHLVDWLPDHVIKGTILSKIATIRNFVEDTLPFKPGAPGNITDADVQRLREEAIKLLGLTQILRTKWIDTTITTEVKVTPQDILNIWNAVEEAKLFSPELYKYVAGLDANAKKLIVKAALKGMVPLEVEQFAKQLRGAKTKKQVTEVEYVPPSKEAIARKLADLIEKEIRTRKLWVEQEVRDELKTLSVRWRPFDPSRSARFTQYRWSSAELYADAISVLFNDPAFLRSQAPKFYEAFFNYLEAKPEVKEAYEEIQREIRSGEVDKVRTKRIYDMFDEGNKAYGMQYKDLSPSVSDALKRDFIDTFHFIIKDIRKVGEGNIAVNENPRYKLEEMVYTGSEIEGFLTDLYSNVIKPLEAANLKWDREFGFLTFLRRVAIERDKMANSLGWDATTAINKMEAMKTMELTPAQWDALKEATKNFRILHEKHFVDKAEAAQIYDDKLIKLFRDRGAYVTFDVLPYLVKRYGHAVATRVHQQIGTLQRIANPATATIMKDVAFIKAANRNTAVRSVVKFYQDYGQNLGMVVKEAHKKWNGKYMEIQEPTDKALGLVVYLYKGKAYGYYLPKDVASALNNNTTKYASTARLFRWLSQPFRKIFTELNYGFWIFNAFFRDAQRMVMALPGYRVDKFASAWLRGLKPAFKSTFGIPDDVVKEMQEKHMLISIASMRDLNDEDQQMERMLHMYHMKPPAEYHSKIMQPFGHMFNWVANRARLAEYYFTATGQALERTTKVGTYKYLKENFPDMPDEVLGHLVRNRGGSPDFLRAGREQSLYNNILMFSNAIKEGYRGDYEAFKDNPGQFMIKKFTFMVMPKLLMYAGLLGLLGAGVKDIFEGVTEYDLTNYIIIPLGRTQSGKSVYWRIPTDETSRFLGGILWKIFRAPELGITSQASNLFDYMAGQAPTVSPAITAISDVMDYVGGKNPYDRFYGRHAVGDTEFAAFDSRAHLQFAQYLVSKMGASIVYKFKHDKVERIAEELESVIGFPINSKVADFIIQSPDAPVVSNILGRFLKVTDYGVREDILRAKQKVKRENARGILDAREAAYAIVEGKELDNKQLLAIAQKPDVVNRAMMLALARKYGMVYFEEWMSAGSNAEKFAVLATMMEKNALSYQDVTGLASPPPAETQSAPAPAQKYPGLNIKDLLEKETRK